jgi:hypothetical protein
MVPIIEEYSVLTEFPKDIHKVSFHRKIENTIEELVKLLRIHKISLDKKK